MNVYVLDLLNSLDDQLVIHADEMIDYGRIRRQKYAAVGFAGVVAAAILLYVCIPVHQNISMSVYADNGKVQISEDGTTFYLDSLSETSAMARELFEIKIHATKKTRLINVSRWENGKYIGSEDITTLDHYVSETDSVQKGDLPSHNWLFFIPVLWENRDIVPLEEILKFEFEDGTVIHKKITINAIEGNYWYATITNVDD